MRSKIHLFAAVFLAICGLMLTVTLLNLSSPDSVTAQAVAPTAEVTCDIVAISGTTDLQAALGISDTCPGGVAGRKIYFANHEVGVITLTVTLTGSNSTSETVCYLWQSPAFGRPADYTHTLPLTRPTIALTYPVDTDHGPIVSLTLKSFEGITGGSELTLAREVALTFTQDLTGPKVTNLNIARGMTSTALYPVGTTLYYTHTQGKDTVFSLNGNSEDDGAGLWKTRFVTADLGCGPQIQEPQSVPTWSTEYCLSGLPAAGVLTATSYDYVGNSTPGTFTNRPDGASPTSTITAAVTESRKGKHPIEVVWDAGDGDGCGVEAVELYYRTAGSLWAKGSVFTGTTLSETEPLHFVPPMVAMTAPITYGLTSVAVDYLGNRELLPADEDTVVVVYPASLYLPLIIKIYPPPIPLTNGDFESGLEGWGTERGPFDVPGIGKRGQGLSQGEESGRARLGNPNVENDDIPVGYGSITQTFTVQKEMRYLKLEYQTISNDVVKVFDSNRYYDTFEVSLNRSPDQVSDVERDTRGCTGVNLNPEGELVVSEAGLVFCGGRPNNSIPAGDQGTRTVTLDLSSFQGEDVTLYLTVWSREYSAPYYNDHAWFNTYAYVDNIELTDQ